MSILKPDSQKDPNFERLIHPNKNINIFETHYFKWVFDVLCIKTMKFKVSKK